MQRRISYFAPVGGGRSNVVSMSVFLCLRAYFQNYSTDLQEFFLHALIFFSFLYFSVKIFSEDSDLCVVIFREFSQKMALLLL